jgi:hypothetical protein
MRQIAAEWQLFAAMQKSFNFKVGISIALQKKMR